MKTLKKSIFLLFTIVLLSSCSKDAKVNEIKNVQNKSSEDKKSDETFKLFENYIGKKYRGKMGGFITIVVEKNYSYMQYEAPKIDPDNCSSEKVRKLHGKFQRYGTFLQPRFLTVDSKKYLTADDFPEDKFYVKNDYTIIDTETNNEYICAENKN